MTETLERPILFSPKMVRATLGGHKTQTRRVLRLPRWSTGDWNDFELDDAGKPMAIAQATGCLAEIQRPYGRPGDRLWVREAFQVTQPWGSVGDEWIGDDLMEIDGPLPKERPENLGFWWQLHYRADDSKICSWWRPSIFMPRWASRILLEVLHVRVERVREISPEDADAEGLRVFWRETFGDEPGYFAVPSKRFKSGELQTDSLVEAYIELWDEINAKRGFDWDANPWVWVIEFSVITPARQPGALQLSAEVPSI